MASTLVNIMKWYTLWQWSYYIIINYNNYNQFHKKYPSQCLSPVGFLFFLFFYFLTLQYCFGFAIYQNESATGIHVFPILNPPPSPYHPSGSSQCTSPKHLVLCIEPNFLCHKTSYIIIKLTWFRSEINACNT